MATAACTQEASVDDLIHNLKERQTEPSITSPPPLTYEAHQWEIQYQEHQWTQNGLNYKMSYFGWYRDSTTDRWVRVGRYTCQDETTNKP
mmetsp:Transcript_20301/g.24064  ORF Transcript_20301/g.24064 Transcript_20301/m.24064 type:complete len:90 (+) Transcript_20301:2689-2958(+)